MNDLQIYYAAVNNEASSRIVHKLGFHKIGEVGNQKQENHYGK